MMRLFKQHLLLTKPWQALRLCRFKLSEHNARLVPACVAAAILLSSTVSGCADIKPWVKPYERDNLADPIMSLSRHGYSDAYMHHVYQAREGARGAEGGTGGGCGCN